MVKYSDEALDRTFAALADPTRRALLARLEPNAEEGMPVGALAEPFTMSLPAILKHLKVLSDAGLIIRSKSGRTVTCRLNATQRTPGRLDRQSPWTERLTVWLPPRGGCSPEGGTPLRTTHAHDAGHFTKLSYPQAASQSLTRKGLCRLDRSKILKWLGDREVRHAETVRVG